MLIHEHARAVLAGKAVASPAAHAPVVRATVNLESIAYMPSRAASKCAFGNAV